MKTTIIGHSINIIGLDDMDLTAENDSFIYDINDSILAGNFTGRIEIDGKFYEWQVEASISPDEIENLTYENKKMRDFLQKLGFTPDDITTLIINGEKALKRVKEPYSVYAIDNKGSTENVESGLSLDEAKILKEKLTQELRDGVYINTTSSLKVITEFDFDQL
ncbi:hypothetical protein [Aliarcobacter butzleri]|uniref:hypothetical protein n=1 Tax=Aliarcobacter butzleri TaxID=28197 RepID=UPI00263D200A|nr:hypothetical protein [Aliarcobacter butzleri]MDN5096541.1 hypothetical protein [Aliarcobacter butzleri]